MTPLDSYASDELIRRVRSEFIEMPGLRLTLVQAERLWALPHDHCERVLDALVERKFLFLGTDGKFGRLSNLVDAALPPPKPAKAGLHPQPDVQRPRRIR